LNPLKAIASVSNTVGFSGVVSDLKLGDLKAGMELH
jgi:hypothetical protein